MNTVQRGLLVLMKSAVTGQAADLPEGFKLGDAMGLVRSHQLATLVYTGASYCGITQSDPAMQRLFQPIARQMIHTERQRRAIARLCGEFERQEIHFMPVKGCLMQGRYPSPELRTMGDADILIRLDQYDRIRPILTQQGFQEVQTSDHELIWRSPDLLLELHKRLIPSYNRDYYAYYGDGWRLATVRHGSRFAMKQEDEYIYLFTHFAKHYRDGGIGCRHVLDLWVMRRWMQQPDWSYIRRELRKLSLSRFHENMERVIRCWFEDGGCDEVTELISQFIFASGNWGELRSHVLSQEVRHLQDSAPEQVKRKAWIRQVFPSVDGLKYRFPILQKRHWLLPVMWVWRWIDTLLFHRERIGQRVKRLNMIDADSVSDYQRSLNAVGLSFQFEEQN